MYTIRSAAQAPSLSAPADCPVWQQAEAATVGHFHSRSSDHRPTVVFRLLYRRDDLFVYFQVHDRYVRSVHLGYQESVCRDSCVEFFVQPRPDGAYLNFEVNAGGTLLLSCIRDCTRVPGGFKDYFLVPPAVGETVEIHHSLPRRVEPEHADWLDWWVAYRIPQAVFSHCLGELGPFAGQTWRANFYKCADDTSHPHWASWLPVGEPLSFHRPERFGPIQFA